MKLIVFGATGSVGKVLVNLALQEGNTVTAFTRNPSSMESIRHENLVVHKGDLFNPGEVKDAIPGHDVVLCTIGDGGKGQVRAVGTENIIKGMKATGVRNLICQSTLGIGASRANLNFVWKHIMFGLLLKKAYRDHEAQEALVRASGLDWTIVRPSAFTDGERTRAYKTGFSGGERNLSLKISRVDVADFILQQAMSGRYLRQEISISN